MAKKKIVPLILILLGIAFLMGAIISWLDNLTASEPVGLGKWLFDILVALIGAGTGIKGWLEFSKKSEPAVPSTRIVALDDSQVNTAEDGRNIKQGDNSNYFEGGMHYHEADKQAEAHESIGYVPAAKSVTYVHRGKIEDDVIEFLRKGGVGAIIGLHAPGGLGKTELSKKACKDVKQLYDGVLWVDVGKNTPAQVVMTMLNQCGVQLPPNADEEMRRNELRAHLQTRRLLVILDDVRKQALAGINDLLPPRPCSCLITSRIQQMSGIKTFALDHMTVEQSRELMRAILGDEVVAQELEMADKLTERVAWNPLALEIAARRALQYRVAKPIAHYFEKAKDKFPELQMDGDERWDMRKVFDISYLDLNAEDQRRFRALAVFHPTGFSPSAVSAIWEMNETETDKTLSRFTNLSLVKHIGMADAEHIERYRFHDLLDEYATLLLNESGEGEGAYTALAEWLINLFDEHYTDDFSNAPEVGLEFASLAKTAEWAIVNRKGDMLASLATKPRNWLFNYFRRLNDWLNWLEHSLQIGIDDTSNEGKQLKANVRKAIGDVQQFRDDRDAALVSYNEALKLFKEIGDKLGEANVRKAIGDVQQFRKETDAALVSYNEALKLFKEIGDKLGEANVRKAIGDVQQFRKETDAALVSYNEALKLFKEIGDKLGEANVLQAIGDVQQFRKETDAALVSYNEALKLFKEIGDKLGEANVLQAIGDVQQFRDDRDAALVSYNEALKLFKEIGDKLGEANVRKAIGDVQQFRDDRDAALVSYNEALKLFKEIGDKLGEANVRKAIGDVQQFRDDRDAALVSYNEALKLFKEIGDKLGEANVRKAIGDVQQFRDDRDAALVSYNEALKLFKEIGAKLGEANVYLSLGGVKRTDKNYEGARMDFQNAFDIYRMIGDQYSQGRALYRLGDCLFDQEKYSEALEYYEKAIQLWNAIGVKDLVESILSPRVQTIKEKV